jgi:diacylglycerol kinase
MKISPKGKNEPFSLRKRLNSFRAAANGIRLLIRDEHNARIHLVILAVVIISGFILKISLNQWLAVTFAAGLVLACESLNSAVEYLSDQITTEYNENIKKAKDIAAAGVLIAAAASVVIGLMVFIPAIMRIFRG